MPSPAIRGFTLIELLIVIVVIAALAWIANPPSDKSYHMILTVRDDLKRFDEVKPRIAEFRARKGAWPMRNEELGVPESGLLPGSRYPMSLHSDGGVTFRLWMSCSGAECRDGRREMGTLSLRPAVNAHGEIVWLCGASKEPPGYETRARNRTSARKWALPAECE